MIDDGWGTCPFIQWCPHKSAPCKVLLPDEGCPVYRYFKKLIEKN